MDTPLCLQSLHKDKKLPFHDGMEFCHFIHKMDHSQIDIVCAEPAKKILKGFFCFWYVSGAHILAVLPSGAYMPLHDPFFAAACNGVSDIGRFLFPLR